jgi:hypothetical protein
MRTKDWLQRFIGARAENAALIEAEQARMRAEVAEKDRPCPTCGLPIIDHYEDGGRVYVVIECKTPEANHER